MGVQEKVVEFTIPEIDFLSLYIYAGTGEQGNSDKHKD
ncbi:hypothetical protein KKC1_26320 [Calderihabitans maritimus]|uniref:Uncharacterized protein n=1 Tax=Calderihabitans maritimus TaxID=1246530 RepID=A0A1Z5HW02_9FIRM|nr:hypothetical protein KKC1_26320 [Calderihabitans maritimus]